MRYATTPRWVFVMLIAMGMAFTAGAFGFILFVPPPTGLIVGGIWLVIGTVMEAVSVRGIQHAGGDDRVRRTGSPGTATVLSAKTTGWVVNGVPQWVMRLRIDGYGAPYETQLKLQTYSPPSNGATFSVRIDPLRKEHIVIADDAGDSAAAASPSATVAAGTGGVVMSGAGVGALSPQLKDSVIAALRQAGIDPGSLDGGTATTVNADGSRTITTTTIGMDGDALREADVPRDAAETVRLLADLDRMRASGALGESEFETVKRRLLGEG
jgi:hypothetical protein